MLHSEDVTRSNSNDTTTSKSTKQLMRTAHAKQYTNVLSYAVKTAEAITPRLACLNKGLEFITVLCSEGLGARGRSILYDANENVVNNRILGSQVG